MSLPNITIPVDLTNPGQFFACCGLLELADRFRADNAGGPPVEGWFGAHEFSISGGPSLEVVLAELESFVVSNTMTASQRSRLDELSALRKSDRNEAKELEKKALESLRRELPITFTGSFHLCADWFCDDFAGGSRFKTWAGQQSVLDIAQSMHNGVQTAQITGADDLWKSVRSTGLPFNFDSDLGGQGSARDIGFSFDPLASSEMTRVEGSCRPALELLCFIGLQRFRPLEMKGENRFVYAAWNIPASVTVASALACTSVSARPCPVFEFPLLYRTKYLKSFLPAQPFQGASHG